MTCVASIVGGFSNSSSGNVGKCIYQYQEKRHTQEWEGEKSPEPAEKLFLRYHRRAFVFKFNMNYKNKDYF